MEIYARVFSREVFVVCYSIFLQQKAVTNAVFIYLIYILAEHILYSASLLS